MPKIVGIIGQRLSGKDEIGEYLVKKYGAYHIKYSNILDEILDILDMPKSRRNEIDVGMAMRAAFHEGVLNRAIKKKIAQAKNNVKVINGIRFLDEFENAKNMGAKFIYVTAPQDILYQRFLSRNQKADDMSLSAREFANLENEPTETKIADLGKQCDFKIENTASLEELYQKVDEIMENIK